MGQLRTATCTACGKSIFFADATGVWLHHDNDMNHDGEPPPGTGDVEVSITLSSEAYARLVEQAEARDGMTVEAYLLALIEIDGEALADGEDDE